MTACTERIGSGISGCVRTHPSALRALSLLVFLSGCLDFSEPRPQGAGAVGPAASDADGDACPSPGVAAGDRVGTVIDPWKLRDRNREEVPLYDFCGKVVLLGVGAGWCIGCREEMPDFVEWQEELGDSLGIYYVLWQDDANLPASSTFAGEWEDEYASNFPIVTDPVGAVRQRYAPNLELPITLLMDRQMVIRAVDHYPEVSRLKTEIDALIAE